ncbi:hypothetical protein B0J14DRAFT_569578 [Halenospora varia]|nr:hypothetical protein B0J14DRAFT_569578 [Halenospora varia]
MSSSKQLVGGGRKNGSGISKKGQPKKDVKKLLANTNIKEKEDEDDEDNMLIEDRDNAKKIKDRKADKKMKMFISLINASSNKADRSSSSVALENGTTTIGSNASRSGTSGPSREISLTALGHLATSATSNDEPEALTTSSLFVGSDKPSSNSQQGHTSGPPLSRFGNPIPNLFTSPPPNPIPNPLTSPPFANPPVGPPIINLVDKEGALQAPATDEDPYNDDAGLFTPKQNKVVTGRSDDKAVVTWRQQGYLKQVVVRYGPKKSPRYERSIKAKAGIPFNKKATPQTGPDHRFGDKKIGRKFEVPLSIKHIWPNPTQCKEYLYNVACDYNKKHQAWQSGQREGREASPSPGLEMDRLMPTGPQVTIKPEVYKSSGIPPTKTKREHSENLTTQ